MGCLLLLLGLALGSGSPSGSDAGWADKAVEVGGAIDSVYVGYYGLGVTTEFTDRLTDKIEIRYPSEPNGRKYDVREEHPGGVITLYVVPRGYKPVKSEQLNQMLANALRMFADILEGSGRGENMYFVISLPSRFEDHSRIEPIF